MTLVASRVFVVARNAVRKQDLLLLISEAATTLLRGRVFSPWTIVPSKQIEWCFSLRSLLRSNLMIRYYQRLCPQCAVRWFRFKNPSILEHRSFRRTVQYLPPNHLRRFNDFFFYYFIHSHPWTLVIVVVIVIWIQLVGQQQQRLLDGRRLCTV